MPELYHRADEEPDDGHQQCRQQVERAAIFQPEQGEAAASDEQTTNNQQFCHEGIADGSGREAGHQPEHALPAEENGSRQYHAYAIGGGKHHGRHEVERGVGEEEGVVALQGREHRPEHRQRSDAIEQDGSGKAVGKTVASRLSLFGKLVDQAFETSVDVEGRPHYTPYGERNDEEHGILRLAEMRDGGIEAYGERCQTQCGIKHLLIFFLDATVEHGTDDATHDDGSGVDDGSYHKLR